MIQLDWSLVKETLADAIELAPERREEFLSSRCGVDTHLRDAVDRLLRGHDSAKGFLDKPPAKSTIVERAPPQRVGPYLLRERLGEGGFGVVYRATQTHPFDRDVAIKLLKMQSHASAVAERFRTERDALARMDHEDICRVLDAGLTEEGSPFVVMELVRGNAINDHCASHRLAVREQAALVARAARAVHHAHQRAVIHCDVKPSNILVSVEGDTTRLRLIDFGIARAIDEADPDARNRSDLAGTPRCMSPERRTATRAADVRSDVYSLGSVLAELLKDAETADLARGARLCSDLHAIATLATTVDPAGRCDSAAAFADDIDRALRNEPLRAMPQGAWGRGQRFVRRNRVASVLTATAALAIIAGTGFALKGRAGAIVARDAATREARRAEFVSTFLLDDMLGSLDPDVARGRDVTVLELLARVDERMRTALADDPLLLADVAAALGGAYAHIGSDSEAITAFEFAIAMREQVDPPAPEHILSWRLDLAEAMFGDPIRHVGAVSLRAQNALDAIATLGPWHPISMRARLKHTPMPIDVTARTVELEEIAARARSLGPDGEAISLDAMRGLAKIYGEFDRQAESLALFEQVVAATEKRFGPAHSETIVVKRDLAESLMKSGEHDRASDMFDEVVIRTRALIPAEHPALTGILTIVAAQKVAMDRPNEAIPLAEEVERAVLERDGPDSMQYISARLTRGQALVAASRFDGAITILEPLIPTLRLQWGDRHVRVGRALLTLARAKAGTGDRDGAIVAATGASVSVASTSDIGVAALEVRCRTLVEVGRNRESHELARGALREAPSSTPPEMLARLRALQAELGR
ncbi:MAG: serine/threonine-protein kinase [Phycisphaerae bacterium]|nr:serine/threonine-protein kinase [Phycisphaerae bacterium]